MKIIPDFSGSFCKSFHFIKIYQKFFANLLQNSLIKFFKISLKSHNFYKICAHFTITRVRLIEVLIYSTHYTQWDQEKCPLNENVRLIKCPLQEVILYFQNLFKIFFPNLLREVISEKNWRKYRISPKKRDKKLPPFRKLYQHFRRPSFESKQLSLHNHEKIYAIKKSTTTVHRKNLLLQKKID